MRGQPARRALADLDRERAHRDFDALDGCGLPSPSRPSGGGGTLLFMGAPPSGRVTGPADIAARAISIMVNTALTDATGDLPS
jgi:hypothetical protein